jgi:hypothetical protein
MFNPPKSSIRIGAKVEIGPKSITTLGVKAEIDKIFSICPKLKKSSKKLLKKNPKSFKIS